MKKNFRTISLTTKKIAFCVVDAILVNVGYLVAAFFSYEYQLDSQVVQSLMLRAPIVAIVFVIAYAGFGLYSSIWKYAGTYELTQCMIATMMASVACVGIDKIFTFLKIGKFSNFQPMIYLSAMLLTIMLVGGLRLSYRALRRRIGRKTGVMADNKKIQRIMIVGAGDMGVIIRKEYEANNYRLGKPVLFVDDNPGKQGQRLTGIPIKGGCDRIPELAKAYNIDSIVVAFPSAASTRQAEVIKLALTTGCTLKISPTVSEMNTVTKGLKKVRNVEITDLLSRPEVVLNTKVCAYIGGQTVLVTGGGGSIGSELCRQIAKYQPSKIVIFDNYENNAFELKNSLDYIYCGSPCVEIRIGSVQDKSRLREVFLEYRPSIVFHAAAHKHVPLMEDSPCEAVKNNIFGTFNTAEVAAEFKVKNFVILSTDKAVNPANVMGATKRVTELIVQYFDTISPDTKFAAVRFGNVLGSNGSVIPIFKEQIEHGGPITVTDPEITRYFMTIPEAAQLVVQAGGLSKGGEVFVLDMGEPVKILSLAENLIKLSGLIPYVDIDIQFTGLRPGEKLYEELSMEEERQNRQMTANNKIFVTVPIETDYTKLIASLNELKSANTDNVRDLLKKIVPNYIENGHETDY